MSPSEKCACAQVCAPSLSVVYVGGCAGELQRAAEVGRGLGRGLQDIGDYMYVLIYIYVYTYVYTFISGSVEARCIQVKQIFYQSSKGR